ncbi:MAG: alpha/beta hydrolase [Bacteriovoracaceae bacterium]|nr:alpha/beta hydrolase [Bacteriovoracaceae bacterium]
MSHKDLHALYLRLKDFFMVMRNPLILSQGKVKIILLLLCTSCSGVFYQPIKGALLAPQRVGLEPEETWITSKDGTKLLTWAFRAQSPKGTIILFHGNAENMSSHFFNLAWLVKQEYDLLVFDYRGYGFSEGEPSQKGVYEDALAALDWSFKDHQSRQTKTFIVYGQSLGGQIAARAIVDFPHQKEVSLLVQDSTFPSYKDIAFAKMKSVWLTWPLSPLAYLVVSDEYASKKVLSKIAIPVLFMHAPDDPVVPYELGKEGFDLVKSKKWWWKIEKGQHTDAFHLQNTTYRTQFLDLLALL